MPERRAWGPRVHDGRAGNGHRDDALHFLSNGEDFADGSNFGNHFRKVIFLAADRAVDVHGRAKFSIQDAEARRCRAASARVKEVFRKNPAEIVHGFGPSALVERHGVGNGAVAVKDVAAEGWLGISSFKKFFLSGFAD